MLVALKLDFKVVKIDDAPLSEVEVNVEVVDINEIDFVSVELKTEEKNPLLTDVVVATIKIE